ncbi:Stk1 family PASTA domain-containing Ser/Thr kinase [Virgibacillus necropolis]|uniref:Serine/threonine-protein kinase PrkC n=1 Tax=Virgibacillus necropolis TaxID=163877 RepID=A0A221MDU0_9BACI|nr:Stk1 family PASTA domain-containing Ser/Thr kinase [Virgibacillus necropolis]ASN05815.1 serine/threonine protein kinase [Virgibacillus necropolis]
MLNGRLLNERYNIKDTIGGGGMANVYLARDIILERDVAIKVLRLEYANDDEFIARFDREAQSATSLSHPNIVNIFDVGEEDHILYMVMEYVDGLTLKEYIQKYGPINVEEALDIMKQVSSAIGHAHANNIVHRDIKPQNILIDSFGQVKVTDFGIAVALSATALTQTNSILGSVHYLSPEQARGGMATKKSDIYSLGIVLFELLTARLPFSGQSPVSIALKHLQTDTPSVRRFNQEVPQSVENIVLKATAKDPFNRFETVYDLEDSLSTALNPENLNEDKFVPAVGVGEETKAIPIITDNQLHGDTNQNTIVHQSDGATKSFVANDEEEPNGKKKEKKKNKKIKSEKNKSKKKKVLWITIILFILLASGVAALFIVPKLMQPDDVSIPDVNGMEYEEAVDELSLLNLKTEKEMAFSEEVKEGDVISTTPSSGSVVKEESPVTLVVSQGKETVTFSDYVGKDYSQTRQLLEDKGFKVIGYDVTSDQAPGEIITQIQPSPDSDVVPSETTVILEYSSGPELISLNNLQGMTTEEAIGYLEEQNLVANTVEEYSDSTPAGEVIRQEPESGTELQEEEAVTIYVSVGPEEKPPVSETVTFTVPYNPSQPPDDGEQPPDNGEQPPDDGEQQADDGEPTTNDPDNPDAPDEPVEQTVKIYVEDADRSISEVYLEETITEDKKYEITLTIAPNQTAEYKVLRDDEVVINKTVSYEEGE